MRCFVVFAVVALCWQCSEGPEPFLPKPVNEAVIGGLDSIYIIPPGASLDLRPEISFTLDPSPDSSRYRYEWIYVAKEGFNTGDEYTVIEESPALTFSPSVVMGAYRLVFRVYDEETELFTEWPFKVFVANEVYEGWMLLLEADGRTQLDMLSYQHDSKDYRLLTDVGSRYPNSKYTLTGVPKYIDFYGSFTDNMLDGGVVVGTSDGAFTFSSTELAIQSNIFLENMGAGHTVPPEAYAEANFKGTWYVSFIAANNQLYSQNESSYSGPKPFLPVYRPQEGEERIPLVASPHMAIDKNAFFYVSVFFDEEIDEFVWYTVNDGCRRLAAGNTFERNKRWKLEMLDYATINGGTYTAIMRDEETGELYVNQFTLREKLVFQKLDGAMVSDAEHWVTDPNTGRIYFCSNQTAIFEYHISSGQFKRVVDFGAAVTFLKFNSFLYLVPVSTGTTVSHSRYTHLQTCLLVGTYAPTQQPIGGSFIVYDPVTKKEILRQDAIPKPIDAVYRER
ncbi:MAG: hypothetical protein EAS52_15730 [Parapedobacter sp.]|nr:MAG: hypothetical protein EAS52_15730 [Parapedobacter sp.]